MWLDRFSGHSTPSGSPPPQSRSYSPAPRRPGHLVPGPLSLRPGYSPRSSSLSLPITSNNSTVSLPTAARIPNGSTLKQQVSPPVDVRDPLDVLQEVIGISLEKKDVTERTGEQGKLLEKPSDVEAEVDFGGLGLQEFVEACERESKVLQSRNPKDRVQFVEGSEKQQYKLEDLHHSILGCDDILKSVETSLASFQTDLGVVSAEIETLQSRSTALNTKLENRKKVEKLLGPAVEDISVSPAIVRKISEDAIDDSWIRALEQMEKRSNVIEGKVKSIVNVKAVEGVKPLLDDLTKKAVERIRDYLVAQIKVLRSPSINAQIIQQQYFLKHKEIYVFLTRHHPILAEEIGQAYINTMRWYYLNHFSRYKQALDKIKLHTIDKYDLLGTEGHSQRSSLVPATKLAAAPHEAFILGRRLDAVKSSNQMAISSSLAEEDKSLHYLEVPFHNFNLALVDNASSEYSFLAEFFSPYPFHYLSRKLIEIFEPTFALGRSLTKQLIDATVDALGVLLCVRLNQRFAFELQRRKIPAVDGYSNGTNMLLWPRFQIVMDMHCESVRRAASLVSGRTAASALSLTVSDSVKQSAAPHFITQRFGQFSHSILLLSSEAGDDEPVYSSLSRLRTEFEALLTKLSKAIGDVKNRERFLYNNYSLILTIISDTQGKHAEEQKQHFETLRKATEGIP